MRKKVIPEVLVRSVMSLYEGVKTRVRVDSELSEEFEAKLRMYQTSVLSLFHLAVKVDVLIELLLLGESLYSDDLVIIRKRRDSGISS